MNTIYILGGTDHHPASSPESACWFLPSRHTPRGPAEDLVPGRRSGAASADGLPARGSGHTGAGGPGLEWPATQPGLGRVEGAIVAASELSLCDRHTLCPLSSTPKATFQATSHTHLTELAGGQLSGSRPLRQVTCPPARPSFLPGREVLRCPKQSGPRRSWRWVQLLSRTRQDGRADPPKSVDWGGVPGSLDQI